MKTAKSQGAPRRRRVARLVRGDRRGAATVEFAICAPIVFLLFLAMVEVSRFHVLRHSCDQAVYEGARVGIVPGATALDVLDAVENRLSQAGVLASTVVVTPPVINDQTETVTVRVEADYQANSWTMPKFFSGATVAAEMTLDHENLAFNE